MFNVTCFSSSTPGYLPERHVRTMSAAAPSGRMSSHHVSYSSSPSLSGMHGGRTAATRLDDAITQLRSLKQNGRLLFEFLFLEF